MRKPGSCATSRVKLRVSSPAPTSSISAMATVATTRPRRRARPPRSPAAPRPPSLRLSCSEVRDTRTAGASPKMSPVRSESSSVKTSTFASRPTTVAGGRLRELSASRAGTPHSAKSRPERAAGERQHDALGEQLADEVAGRRAERHAHGDLTGAGGGARELEVRDVGAGDQQHEAHGAQQHQHRLPHGGIDELVAKRREREGPVGSVVVGLLGLEALGERGHLRLRRLEASRRP